MVDSVIYLCWAVADYVLIGHVSKHYGDIAVGVFFNAIIYSKVSYLQAVERIRKAFNMNQLAKMLSQEKKRFEYLGLKNICASAKDISYYRMYGINTTITKICPFFLFYCTITKNVV